MYTRCRLIVAVLYEVVCFVWQLFTAICTVGQVGTRADFAENYGMYSMSRFSECVPVTGVLCLN